MPFESLETPLDIPQIPQQQTPPAQYVMNPTTGEIRGIDPSQMADAAAQGFTTSPSIENMQEAGILNTSGGFQGMPEKAVVPTIASQDIPTTADGRIDINKSIEKWGDNAARVLEKVVSDEDKPKIRQVVEQIRQPSGQYVWNPQTEEIRLVKSPEEVAKLFDEGWKSPDIDQLKQQGFLDEKGRATFDLRKVSGLATKPTTEDAASLKQEREATKQEREAEKLERQPSGQYVWNPETEEIRLVKDQKEVGKLFNEGWESPTVDKLKQFGVVDETGKANFDITKSSEFKWKPDDDTVRAIHLVQKYGGPVEALANGVSEKDIESAGYDLNSVDKESGKSLKAWYGDLPSEDKDIIKKDGLDAYLKAQERRQGEFEQSHIKDPKTGDWYSKDWYNNFVADQGNKVDIIGQGVKNTTGASRDDVIRAYEEIFRVGGMDNVLKHLDDVQVNKANLLNNYAFKEPFIGPVKEGEKRSDVVVGYDTNRLVADLIDQGATPEKAIEKLESLGFTSNEANDAVKYTTADPEGKFKILQEQGLVPEGATFGGMKDGQVQYYPKGVEQKINLSGIDIAKLDNQGVKDLYKEEFPKNPVPAMPTPTPGHQWSESDYVDQMRQDLFAKQNTFGKAVTMALPVIGTKRSIEERGLGSGWTVMAIVSDALLFTGALKGASVGARAFAYPSRIGRIEAAAKGAAESLVPKIPNLADLKAAAVNIKNTFRPGYLPLPALETSTSVPRLPISAAGSAQEAMAIRDTLMTRLAAGLKPEVTVNGVKYTLDTPLIKGLAHAGPDVGWLKSPDGSVVQVKFKPGTNIPMKESEQGLFVGSGTHSRFAPFSAFGVKGERPGVALFTKSADEAVSTGKTYLGTAEMERKFPVGTKLPKLKSSGVSVTAAGQEFELLTEESIPLKTRIAARVGQPFIEARSTFTPAIKVVGKKVPEIDLLEEARLYDEAAQKALNTGDDVLASRLKAEANDLRLDRMLRPQTPRSAAELSRYLTTSAAVIDRAIVEKKGQTLTRADEERLRTESAKLRNTAQMMDRIAESPELRHQFNERIATIRSYIDAISDRTEPTTERNISTIDRTTADRIDSQAIRTEVSTPERITPERVIGDRINPERIVPERVTNERVSVERILSQSAIPRVETITPKIMTADSSSLKPLRVRDNIRIRKVEGVPSNPGDVTWRQGFVYYTFKPPYRPGTEDILVTSRPPEGVATQGTPRATIITRRGNPPQRLTLDMGVTDVEITKGKKIKFKADQTSRGGARKVMGTLAHAGAFEVHRRGDVMLTRRHQKGHIIGRNRDGLKIVRRNR